MSEQVTTLKRLVELAKEKKCVSVNPDRKTLWMSFKYKPAAFVVSMQGRMIQRMFEVGMYVYEKQERKHERRKPE
jgi:hypothetical protein